jgi:SAM-dependent methyltransferase
VINPNEITKELVLPFALEQWENRWGGSTKIADTFKFWRVRYFVLIALIGIVILFKSLLLGLLVLFSCSLFDYFVARSREKQRFKHRLSILKDMLSESFYGWDRNRREDANLGVKRISEVSPVNNIKKGWMSLVVEDYFEDSFKVLDAGCKDGEMALLALKKRASLVGIDLNKSNLQNFQKITNRPAIQGNILNLPFREAQFDFILFLDVIEHLSDPLQGLKEINRILIPGGFLVVSTDNRNHLKGLDIINPFIVLERLIGLINPRVLMPRNILWEHGQDVRFYHTSFSRTEILSLAKAADLSIISYFSYFFLAGFHEILGKIRPKTTENEYLRFVFPLEKKLASVPLIKWLGDHWLVILRKPAE